MTLLPQMTHLMILWAKNSYIVACIIIDTVAIVLLFCCYDVGVAVPDM